MWLSSSGAFSPMLPRLEGKTPVGSKVEGQMCLMLKKKGSDGFMHKSP